MAYKRTVTCSWCYGHGHNRNGCPDRKEYIANNPESYEATIASRQKARTRKCSYCGDTGHNRRTCPVLKRNKGLAATRNRNFRRALVAWMQEIGLGVGTLVKCKDYWGTVHTGMVTSFDWHRMNVWDFKNNWYGLKCVNVTNFREAADYGWTYISDSKKMPRPPEDADMNLLWNDKAVAGYMRHEEDVDKQGEWIVGRVSACDIENALPEGWLDGSDDALDMHFKGVKHWEHDWCTE